MKQWNGCCIGLEVYKAAIFNPGGIEGSNFRLGLIPF